MEVNSLKREHSDCDSDSDSEDVAARLEYETRRQNLQLQLKARFEAIFDKYERDFAEIGDEIDLETGELVVNNGHLLAMHDEQDATAEGSQALSNPERLHTLVRHPSRGRESPPRPATKTYDADEESLLGDSDDQSDDFQERGEDTAIPERSDSHNTVHADTVWESPKVPGERLAESGNRYSTQQYQRSDRTPSPDCSVWDIQQPVYTSGYIKKRYKTPWNRRTDALLVHLRKTTKLTYIELRKYFPGRSAGTIRAHWCLLQERYLINGADDKNDPKVTTRQLKDDDHDASDPDYEVPDSYKATKLRDEPHSYVPIQSRNEPESSEPIQSRDELNSYESTQLPDEPALPEPIQLRDELSSYEPTQLPDEPALPEPIQLRTKLLSSSKPEVESTSPKAPLVGAIPQNIVTSPNLSIRSSPHDTQPMSEPDQIAARTNLNATPLAQGSSSANTPSMRRSRQGQVRESPKPKTPDLDQHKSDKRNKDTDSSQLSFMSMLSDDSEDELARPRKSSHQIRTSRLKTRKERSTTVLSSPACTLSGPSCGRRLCVRCSVDDDEAPKSPALYTPRVRQKDR